jgi:hypothetical protein
MPSNYVLIDFENVQPKNLELLAEHPIKVYVFVGENQKRIPFDLADSMQLRGTDASYVKITGTGQNALDFHITYYLGQLTSSEPDAAYYVVTKDKGFDPLIRHLREKKVRIRRIKDLGDIPLLQLSSDASMDERIAAIVKNLGGRGQSRPRKVKTLENAINSLFANKLGKPEVSALMKELQKRKLVVAKDNKVSYNLPH